MPTPEEIAAAALVAAAAPVDPTPPATVEPASTPPAEPSRADLWAEIEATEKAKTEPVKAEEEVTPPPAEEGPKDEKPDIWAGATPEQIAARDELAHRARSTSGRIGALQRKINSLQAAAGQANNDSAKKAREAVDSLKGDYPEITQPLEHIVAGLDSRAEADGKLLTDELNAAIAERNDIVDEEEAALTRAHPDWFETLTKDDNRKKVFTAWIDDQPRSVREAAARNREGITDAAGASDVIGRFKAHLASLTPTEVTPPPPAITAPPAQQQQPAAPPPQPSLNDRRQRQLASTAAPKGNGPAAVNGLPDANSGDRSAHWNAFEQLDAQRRQAAAR